MCNNTFMQSIALEVGRRERKRLATRQALIAAATELFVRDGFADTTIATIADLADVAPRTFFLHFASKEDVLFHHVETHAARAVQSVAGLGERATTWEAVQGALGAMIDQYDADPGVDALAPVRAQLVGAGTGLPTSLARRMLALHAAVLKALEDRFPTADLSMCSTHLGAAIGAVAAAGMDSVAGASTRLAPVDAMRDALNRAGRGFADPTPA